MTAILLVCVSQLRATSNLPMSYQIDLDTDPNQFVTNFSPAEGVEDGPPTLQRFADLLTADHIFVINHWDPERVNRTGNITWQKVVNKISTSPTAPMVHVYIGLQTYLDLCSNCDGLLLLKEWFGNHFEVKACNSLTAYQHQIIGEEQVRQCLSDNHPIYDILEYHTKAPELYNELPDTTRWLLARLPIKSDKLSRSQQCLVYELEKLGLCVKDDLGRWACFSEGFCSYLKHKDGKLFFNPLKLIKSLTRVFVAESATKKLKIVGRYLLPFGILLGASSFYANNLWVYLPLSVLLITWLLYNAKDMYWGRQPISWRRSHAAALCLALLIMGYFILDYTIADVVVSQQYENSPVTIRHKRWISPEQQEFEVRIEYKCTSEASCTEENHSMFDVSATKPLSVGKKAASFDGQDGEFEDVYIIKWMIISPGSSLDNCLEQVSKLNVDLDSTFGGGHLFESEIYLFPQNIPFLSLFGICLSQFKFFHDVFNSPIAMLAMIVFTLAYEVFPYTRAVKYGWREPLS